MTPRTTLDASFTRHCPTCKSVIVYKSEKTLKQSGSKLCRSCADQRVREKTQSAQWRNEQSARLKSAWDDPKSIFNDEAYRKKLSLAQLELDPIVRQKVIERAKEAWFRDPSRREKFITSAIQTCGISKIEKRIANLLCPLGWTHQHSLAGYHVDFFHPQFKLAIEIYGDWWHSHPRYDDHINESYGGTHPQLRLSPSDARKRDADRIKKICLSDPDIRIKTVWESEVKRMSDQQILQTVEFMFV